jgi:hypothetical protein
MKQFLLLLQLSLCTAMLTAQVNYNANTNVSPYTQGFHQAANNGYFPGWINEQIGQMHAGNEALNIPGVGTRAMRVGFNEEIAELFGYDILDGLFQQYAALGMQPEHTMIVGYPIDWHRDETFHCPQARSVMFKGMYLPVWDGGLNGTPYNDENYLAVYTYKMVSRYKDQIRFWEIWNEPGFDLTYSTGWLPPGQPGNWWQNDPKPCDYVLHAPVQHYVRTLRVSYDIIKTLDPTAYVTASGLGYPSFLDAILRNTDNPNGGAVTPEYPLKGGAYFDAVGFHSYPHFDGSVRYWDNALGQMVDTRHSDGAADGTIRVWQGYETVLNNYGYNGSTFPRKIKLITEGNIPRKAFDVGTPNESLGGTEVQRNYAIKNVVRLMQNDFAQYDLYQIFETKTLAQASQAYDAMGLYEVPTALGVIPARTEHAIGYHTVSRMLFRTTYNAARTAAMNLPANVGGAAFLNPNGKYVYAIWAKTQTDKSEFASANYSFPAALGLSTLTRRNWDFGQTNTSSAQSPNGIALTSAPIFLTDDAAWPTPNTNPNPRVDLQLSMNATPNNPVAGQNYTWNLTITNSSTVNATGVEVGNFMEFSKQFILDRITYVSHVAPAGTSYDPPNGRWVIGNIPAGQSRTIAVTTRAVHGGIYKTFAQITKCDQLDTDSSPLNGQAIKTPFEDDEAFFIVNNNGFIDTKADWVIEATNYPATAATGATIPVNFMLRNNGRLGGAATTTTVYLSTDAQFSANDQFLTFLTAPAMPAFGYNLHNFTVNLPAGLASGTYYLLFSADFANAVDEADENNIFARAITIQGSTPICQIQAAVSNAVCNNAGTPNNAADDTWTFNLTVTGTNTGAGWTATVAGQTVTGTYGTPKSVTGGLISAGNRTFAVGDQTNTGCTTSVTAVPSAPCSSTPTCQIQAVVSNAVCNNAGTPTVPGDDTWTFDLTVTGTNTGANWTTSVAGQVVTGTYGVPRSVSGGLISAGARTFAVGDQNNAACTTSVTATPPAPCSVAPNCQINAVVSGMVCNNAGTGTTPNDDTYSYALTVTGTTTGTGWSANIAGTTVTGTYGTPRSISGGLISGGVRNFQVIDNQNATCVTGVTVTPPAPCSDPNPPNNYCVAKGESPWEEWISEVRVGTDFQASSKSQYSDFTSKVFAVQNGSSVALTTQYSWFTNNAYYRIWIDLNNDGDLIDAGEQVFEGILTAPAPGANVTKVLTGSIVIPSGTPSANYRMRVAMKRGAFPSVCEAIPVGEVEDYTAAVSSGGTPTCQIQATVSNAVCNNAGTTNTSTDDTWTFNLNVTGTNTGAGWSATVAGQTINGTYGTPRSVSGGLISAGNRIFAVGDITTNTCTTNVTATPPATCSGGGNPGNYCLSKGDAPWQEWISEVRLGTDFYATSKAQYTDLSAIKTFNAQNGMSVSLTTQFSYQTNTQYWRIWMDLNTDGDFLDAGEQVFEGIGTAPASALNVTKTTTGSLVIPTGTPSANYRMRVSMKRGAFPTPCETIPFGEVEDYTAAVTSGGTPTCSITAAVSGVVCNNNNTPTNAADDTYSFNVTVSGSNTGASNGWQVLGANGFSGTYGVVRTVSGLAISGGTLNFTAQDAANSGCSTTFSVTPPAPCSGGTPGTYCNSRGEFPWEDWLSQVQIGTQQRASGKSQYTDNASGGALTIANGSPIALTASYSYLTYDEYCTVWIDLNSDGDFVDAGEQVFQGVLTKPAAAVGATKTLNGNITLPTGAMGTRRMRVSMKRGAYATSCELFTNGEVEDYTVTVGPLALQSSNSKPKEAEIFTEMTLAPNPAMDRVVLHLADPLETEGQVRVLNSLGLNLRNELTLAPGVPQIEIPLTGLPPGLYFIEVREVGKRNRLLNLVIAE